MTNYPNWFAVSGEWYFKKHLSPVEDRRLNALQIGAYTGDATVWLMENYLLHPSSTLTDVDTWKGSDEEVHKSFDWEDVETVYSNKTQKYAAEGKLIKFRGDSDSFFSASGFLSRKYDFIYVDGDHTARAVLKDGMNALEVCAPGGIVAFDDYMWRSGRGATYDPYPAIDALMVAYADKFEVIEKGAQVWMRNVQ